MTHETFVYELSHLTVITEVCRPEVFLGGYSASSEPNQKADGAMMFPTFLFHVLQQKEMS